MFKRVKLTNFRQHRDLEVRFEGGVNALRGANEAGKTTILEGIAYCMGGAKIALREPIDKVVTWGEKTSSLKTEIEAEINGVTYIGKRSKSGAEVWLPGETRPLVTGQDECTRFWESQIGASMKVCTNLMMANQQSIRGALEGGAAAPVILIEQLANFKLLDLIMNLVKEKVPNGQTKLIEDRVTRIKGELAEPVEDLGIEALEQTAGNLLIELNAATHAETQAKQAVRDFGPTASAAQTAINTFEQAVLRHQSAVRAQQRAQSNLASIEVPDEVDTTKLEGLRRQVTDKNGFANAKQAHAQLTLLGTPDAEWDEGLDSLKAAIRAKADAAAVAATAMQALNVKIAQAEGKVIKETQCAFCDKVLSDVPEVVTRNKELADLIQALYGDLADQRETYNAAVGDAADLQAVLDDHNRRQRTLDVFSAYISVDTKYVPHRWTWTGVDLDNPPEGDPAAEIARIEAAVRRRDQAVGAHEQAKAALTRADQLVTDEAAAMELARAAVPAAELDVKQAENLAGALAAASIKVGQAREAHQTAQGALATAQAVQRERQTARGRLQADLLASEEEVTRTRKGNALLEKLRTARPQIADKLWSTVLSVVSTYFSQIRGTKSVVTRADNGFQVDGHDIEGLSGSTLDALGLAIRLALTKTFLPAARFLTLDEPAAACDDGREANMIGLVATADFDQVLLVTHSSLADAFAAQVIQL